MKLNCFKFQLPSLLNFNPVVESSTQEIKALSDIISNEFKLEHETNIDQFQCHNCGEKFSLKSTMKNHIRKNLTLQKISKCDYCRKQFLYKCEFRQHTKMKISYTICTVCGKSVRNKATPCFANQRENFKCSDCSDVKSFSCKFCDMKFDQRSTLKTHLKSHRSEKPYECDLCHQHFSNLQHVKRHIEVIHNGETNYQCEYCNKCFRWDSSLRTHIKTHTNERPHRCSSCTYSFRRSCDLKRHMITHTNEKNFSCVHCDKKFTRNSSLQRHIRAHFGEKPYLCNVCGKRFNESFFLKEHMESHSENRLYYHCDHCDKRFNNRRVLRVHAKKHANENSRVELPSVTKDITDPFEESVTIANGLHFFNYLDTSESL